MYILSILLACFTNRLLIPDWGHCRTDDGVDGATYWLLFFLLQHIVVIMEKRESVRCVCVCVCGTRVFGKNQCMASNRVVLDGMGWDGRERSFHSNALID